MDAIIAKLAEDWPIYTLAAVILIKLFQSELIGFLPKAVQQHFSAKAKMLADQQEHQQTIDDAEMNLAKFKQLSQLSSLSFTEEQLTQLTAETQVQLNEANSFVRGIVSDKLDMILEKIGTLKEVMYEVKETQSFILYEIRNADAGDKAE